MTHKEKALDLFSKRYMCSQAVLAAFAEKCGIPEKQALRVSSCFGSGMRKGEVCGACTGALMVLGLLYGQDDVVDTESKMRSIEVTEKLMERFSEACGSYLCNDLLGCDIRTREGREYAVENSLFTEFCPTVVANAVDILEQIIREYE